MKNPLEQVFESPEELYRQLIVEIDKIGNYKNRDGFHPEILKNSQLGAPAVTAQELQKLLQDVRDVLPEKRAEILDLWLIERDQLTSVVAGLREDYGIGIPNELAQA